MARYNPGIVDDQIVGRELIKIADALDTPDKFLMLETQYVAPTKLRDGMIAFADGTQWNPGSGAGVYAYFGATWNKLG